MTNFKNLVVPAILLMVGSVATIPSVDSAEYPASVFQTETTSTTSSAISPYQDVPPPTLPPLIYDDCVIVDEQFSEPQTDLPSVDLGMVQIVESLLSNGEPAGLNIRECPSGSGTLGVGIPVSDQGVERFASIEVSDDICQGEAPTGVSLTITYFGDITLRAYDDSGNRVDEVTDSQEDITTRTLSLQSSAGIRRVELIGIELCILDVCWTCGANVTPTPTERPDGTATPTPGIPPVGGNCVRVDDVYTTPGQDLQSPSLFGRVLVTNAVLPDGSPAGLTIQPCPEGNGPLGLWIPWSEANAQEPASLVLTEEVCQGNAPTQVTVSLVHYNQVTLRAMDSMGNMVDQVSNSSVSDQGRVLQLTLNSSTGIRVIEVEGAEICIEQVCWNCESTVEPTATPQTGSDICVTTDILFSEPQSNQSIIDFGPVEVLEPVLSNGTPAGLDVRACPEGIGPLGVWVDFSETGVQEHAMIVLKSGTCDLGAPSEVTVDLVHYNRVTLVAMDENGNTIDQVSNSAVSDQGTVLPLTLSSQEGIHRIAIQGSEICIQRICWDCDASDIEPTPTDRIPTQTPTATPSPSPFVPPTPEPTPTVEPTDPPLTTIPDDFFDFIGENLDDIGLVSIPGGFEGRPEGENVVMGFEDLFDEQGNPLFPNSEDNRGIGLTVEGEEVVFLHTESPMESSAPVLLRLRLRATGPDASIALIGLKGDLATGTGVNGALGLSNPAMSSAYVDESGTLLAMYHPIEGVPFTPAIQVSTSADTETTVYVDRLEMYVMDESFVWDSRLFTSTTIE